MNKSQAFDNQVETFQRQLVQLQLNQCTSEQQKMFNKVYPKGVDGLKGDQLRNAYLLCRRTLEEKSHKT